MGDEGPCWVCGDPVGADGGRDAGGLRCQRCAEVFADRPSAGLQVPEAVGGLATDLGVLGGLHLWLLGVDVWSDRVSLRAAFDGPAGLWEREPHGPRGRWTVTDADGRSGVGRMGNAGGGDLGGIGEVRVDRPAPEALPWTVELHRGGDHSRVVVEQLHPMRTATAVVHEDVWHSAGPVPGTCSTCGASRAGGPRCDPCRSALRSMPPLLIAGAIPMSDAIAVHTGDDGIGCFLSVERWPGQWVLRHHVAVDWVAPRVGLRGRWRASVDGDDPVDGAMTSGGADDHGVLSDITFPGDLDPAAQAIALTLVRGEDTPLADVVLPLAPGDRTGRSG